MKNWKKLLVIVSLTVMTTLPASATTLKTVGGAMELPKGVSSYTLSKSEFAKLLYVADNKPSATTVKEGNSVKIEDVLGKYGDFYQIQGQDKEGVKTAEIVAVDINKALQDSKNLRTVAMLNTINSGNQIDPATEAAMLAAVNSQLGSLESAINASFVNNKYPDDSLMMKVKLQDIEQLQVLPHANYKTYVMGTRALLNINGFQLPYYLKAAVILKPKTPTAFLMVTSDIERSYFNPMMTNMVASFK